jgi:putative phage-type endonuclease
MRIGCEDRSVEHSVAVPSDRSANALGRAEMLDRAVLLTLRLQAAAQAAAARDEPPPFPLQLDHVNLLNGAEPPLSASELASRLARVRGWRRQLAALIASPGIAQRTPEWYEARLSLLTASDAAQALGCAKFGNQRAFFQKKCGLPEEQAPFDADVPPLKWGVMYEPVAQAIYSASGGGVRVHEFGLLRHPTIPHLGASPDGITELGVMLEIKCPWRRRIDGEVPMQYYHQVQAQLAVCGLEECDYFECEFDECDGPAHERWGAGGPSGAPYERGAFAEVLGPGAAKRFAYPEPVAGPGAEALLRWLEALRAEAAAAGATAVRPHWWTLRKRSTLRVAFDAAFTADMFARLAVVWDAVGAFRADRERYLAEVGAATPPAPRAGWGGLPDVDSDAEDAPTDAPDAPDAPDARDAPAPARQAAPPRAQQQQQQANAFASFAFVDDD